VIFSQEDISGHVFTCPAVAMTAPPGAVIYFVEHDGTAHQGNTNFTVTATSRHQALIGDDGKPYYEDAALWFGGVHNANNGLDTSTLTASLNFVTSGGGTVGKVSMVFHLSPNGMVKDFNFGNCTA